MVSMRGASAQPEMSEARKIPPRAQQTEIAMMRAACVEVMASKVKTKHSKPFFGVLSSGSILR